MAGRPTKYSDEMLALAEGYLESDTLAPNIAELSRVLDVSRSTLYKWAEEHDDFSDMLERILAEQERRLISGGLSGKMNATITKLMLAKHGYHDKQDNTHASPDGGPVQVIERRIVKANPGN